MDCLVRSVDYQLIKILTNLPLNDGQSNQLSWDTQTVNTHDYVLSFSSFHIFTFLFPRFSHLISEISTNFKFVYVKWPECPKECDRRCSQTQYHNACILFCNKCCRKCLCVPPGYYGNKQVCSCYNNWKTQQGGPKCPWKRPHRFNIIVPFYNKSFRWWLCFTLINCYFSFCFLLFYS